ncbi:MAG: hypothetical protein KKA56_08535, partial [Gammaproteobacteria bacterium]|nr:hypothetical protein [Gammaproteobacteria bacterium]
LFEGCISLLNAQAKKSNSAHLRHVWHFNDDVNALKKEPKLLHVFPHLPVQLTINLAAVNCTASEVKSCGRDQYLDEFFPSFPDDSATSLNHQFQSQLTGLKKLKHQDLIIL